MALAPVFDVRKPHFTPSKAAAGPTAADPMNETLFVAPALAATLSALAVWLLARAARALPPDIPNARSLHVQPVPRAGGYAIWAGFIPAALLFAQPFPVEWKVWLPGWAALTLVSAMDDVSEV